MDSLRGISESVKVKAKQLEFPGQNAGEESFIEREKEKGRDGGRGNPPPGLQLPNDQHVCIRKSSKIGERTT